MPCGSSLVPSCSIIQNNSGVFPQLTGGLDPEPCVPAVLTPQVPTHPSPAQHSALTACCADTRQKPQHTPAQHSEYSLVLSLLAVVHAGHLGVLGQVPHKAKRVHALLALVHLLACHQLLALQHIEVAAAQDAAGLHLATQGSVSGVSSVCVCAGLSAAAAGLLLLERHRMLAVPSVNDPKVWPIADRHFQLLCRQGWLLLLALSLPFAPSPQSAAHSPLAV